MIDYRAGLVPGPILQKYYSRFPVYLIPFDSEAIASICCIPSKNKFNLFVFKHFTHFKLGR